MRNYRDLLDRMQDFCTFLAKLADLSAKLMLSPMAEGKWSMQEVIAHIMVYDEIFLQSVVLALEDGRLPVVPDPADNQTLNDKAAALGRKLTKGRLLSRATLARTQLVDHLRRLPAERFLTRQEGLPDGDLGMLLQEDCVDHDRLHVEQMREYLKSHGRLGMELPGGEMRPP